MEGISSVRHTINEGDWLTKLDLKDGYLTVIFLKPIEGSFSLHEGGGGHFTRICFPTLRFKLRAMGVYQLLRLVVAFLQKKAFAG